MSQIDFRAVEYSIKVCVAPEMLLTQGDLSFLDSREETDERLIL